MTDKEIFKAELDRLKEETSIGLSEWENGVEHGRMEIINALYITLDSMQKEPVSEDKMTISKEWFEHCKKSWYNEGYLDGEYNRDRQFAKNNSITLADLGEFIIELSKQFPEVSFAKVCKIATRTAKWQKKQMMAKAINTKASLIMSVPSICISLPLGVNVGDKVKVVVIEED